MLAAEKTTTETETFHRRRILNSRWITSRNISLRIWLPMRNSPPQTYQYNPYFQNPNFLLQDPNLLLQQIASSLIQFPKNVASSSNVDYSQVANFPTQTLPPELNPNPPAQTHCSSDVDYSHAANFPTQTPSTKQKQESNKKPNTPAQNRSPNFPSKFQRQQRNSTPSRKVALEKIEVVVEQARGELIASAENVSTWKVIESALVKLNVESWDFLGIQLQQVPSLLRLIVIEGKINAFIHCFVDVRTITSLYDLQVAICENEDIGNFEELELGPLIRHPLIEHYFASNVMTEVYNIRGEEIISHLKMYYFKHAWTIEGTSFLQFVADKCKVHSWEKMGLRIQSLGYPNFVIFFSLACDLAV